MKLKPRNNDALINLQLSIVIVIFSVSYLITMGGLYYLGFAGYIPANAVNDNAVWAEILARSGDSLPIAQAKARTMLIGTMYLTESFLILSIRRMNSGVIEATRKDANFFVWLSVIMGPALYFSIMFVDSVAQYLIDYGIYVDLITLSVFDLIIVVVFATIPLVLLEYFKKHRRSRGIQF
jgi:magnesium-transporting ATPase (P-type)